MSLVFFQFSPPSEGEWEAVSEWLCDALLPTGVKPEQIFWEILFWCFWKVTKASLFFIIQILQSGVKFHADPLCCGKKKNKNKQKQQAENRKYYYYVFFMLSFHALELPNFSSASQYISRLFPGS